MPVLLMRTGLLCISGARGMLASGGRFSSGGSASLCSALQPRARARACEGCLPLLVRPGHCSACSLAEWAGACHGSLVAKLASPLALVTWADGRGQDLSRGLPLPVPLAGADLPQLRMDTLRGAGVELRTRCLIFQLHLEGSAVGTVLRRRGVRAGAPRSGFGRVVLRLGWVSASPAVVVGFPSGDQEVNGSGKRSQSVFHALRRITGSCIGGDLGPVLVLKTLLDNVACFPYRPPPATLFGHVLLLHLWQQRP